MPQDEGADDTTTLAEDRNKAARIREKKDRGATLTRAEAGFLGAVASVESTRRKREEAKKAGREEEFEEEHRTASWMKGEPTRKPEVTSKTKGEIEDIREKQERGEKLARHEAGVLGGTARAEEARKED